MDRTGSWRKSWTRRPIFPTPAADVRMGTTTAAATKSLDWTRLSHGAWTQSPTIKIKHHLKKKNVNKSYWIKFQRHSGSQVSPSSHWVTEQQDCSRTHKTLDLNQLIYEEVGGNWRTWRNLEFYWCEVTSAMPRQELCTAEFHKEIMTFDSFASSCSTGPNTQILAIHAQCFRWTGAY